MTSTLALATVPSTRPIPEELLEADRELARLGRGEAQLRLRIGELLDALFVSNGHHELGFSSIGAYAVERCQQSRRWERSTRGLARSLRQRGLTAVRRAVMSGRIGFSMAELLAKHATPENQDALVAEALGSTVRAMQARLTGKKPKPEEEEPDVRSTRWVTRDELLMMSASRMLVGHLIGTRASDEMTITALLGEAETTLQSLGGCTVEGVTLPALSPERIEAGLAALRAAHARRSGSPDRSEPSNVGPSPAPVLVPVVEDKPLPAAPRELDREIVRIARQLAQRNLRMGRLAQRLLAGGAWRRLGYDSFAQYARERVGVSLSSLEHRATLARRVARYPALGEALCRGDVGYEAALLLGRVLGDAASRGLVRAWIQRARVRTYKHLKEEVDAVLLATSLTPDVGREPPDAEDLEVIAELERSVQSGELFRSYLGGHNRGPQTYVTFASGEDGPGPLRPLRLRLPVEVYAHWKKIEAEFRSVAGPGASFVAFMCFCLWEAWMPYLEAFDDKWKQVYERDRHRCTSPVCERRDVTPHHVKFQAHGGTDELTNMVSLCAWCHLDGIHRGRLRAEGRAPELRWSIGEDPLIEVQGRDAVRIDAGTRPAP